MVGRTLSLVLLDLARARAGNPIITDIYTADPDAFVVGDRFYIDSDQDEAPLGASDFLMRDLAHVLLDRRGQLDAPRRAAVADRLPVGQPQRVGAGAAGARREVLLVPADAEGGDELDVDRGRGRRQPARAVPRRARQAADRQHDGQPSAFDIDPTVFVDDDGQAYIYWGSFSSPRVAKLKENMVELADLSR